MLWFVVLQVAVVYLMIVMCLDKDTKTNNALRGFSPVVFVVAVVAALFWAAGF